MKNLKKRKKKKLPPVRNHLAKKIIKIKTTAKIAPQKKQKPLLKK